MLEKHSIKQHVSYQNIKSLSKNELKNKCDLIIVIGGDGSFLSASRIAIELDIPIVGINCGELGFLTDISSKKINKIEEILNGNFILDSRFILSVKKINSKNYKTALNDVVIFPDKNGNMIESTIFINDDFLCKYRSDGIIISTPTGSTAHALSSGSSILHPKLENILITPMLSHNLSSRPIVIDNKNKIRVIFNKLKSNRLVISCDGQERFTLNEDDSINICKFKKNLNILHPLDYNYFNMLRTKLKWENLT